MASRVLPFLAMIAVGGLCGCSGQLKTYPVSGVVKFDSGGPVKVGIVELQSIEHSVNARGEIQSDGSFTLTTFQPNDGAVGGRHRCAIIQMVIGENMEGLAPSKLGVVDPKYASYLSSGLEYEIIPEQNNELTIIVTGIGKQLKDGEEHKH